MNDKIILIVGESGSGKDTIVNRMCKEYGYKKLISYTTRPMRNDTKDFHSHIFVNDKEFDKLTNIVAYTEFDGYRYCATTEQIDDCDFYIVDCEGVKTLRENYKGNKQLITVHIDVPKVDRFLRMQKRDGTIPAMERIKHDEIAFAEVKDLCDISLANVNPDAIPSLMTTLNDIMKGEMIIGY